MKKLKKYLALFLTFSMLMSMLQLTVFANEAEQTSSAIMNGSYILNTDGTTNGVVSGTDHATIEYKNEGVTLTKFVTQPEECDENEFMVTLQVQTSQETSTTLPVAAIQLVIDVSVTMDYCGTCTKTSCSEHKTRMTELKDVLTQADGFLDTLSKAKASKVYVSVVTYGSGAKTVCDWEDIKTTTGLANVTKAIVGTKNSWNQQQGGLQATDYATNIEAGLMLARNRLGMSEAANADVNYVVLLTDGQANCYVKNDVTSTERISSNDCSSAAGADGTEEGKNAAAKMATEVTPKSTLYGVGYGSEKTYLAAIIGNTDNTFAGNDSASVAKAFNFIAQDAVTGMNGAGTSVTDPMGQFITLDMDEVPAALADKGVSKVGNSIRWELNPDKADAIDPSEDGKTTTYTYTITYPITLDTTADDFVEGYYYPTNGYTYLSVPQLNKQLAFRVPGVSGKIPMVTVSGSKTWNDNNNQDGIRPESITINLMNGTNVVDSKTITADDNWSWEFTAREYVGGVKAEYTIEEEAVEGYIPTYDGYNVTNTPVVTVSGVKTWEDNDDQDGKRPSSITINLMNGENVVESKEVAADADGNWNWSFTAPKYAAGTEIVYSITETPVAGYTAEVDGYNVTNTHATETVTISGSKIWDDNNNQDGVRPSSIIINLMNGENVVESKEVAADADGNWNWSFTAPKYAAGTEIVYSITETPVEKYDTVITGDAESGFVVTNTYSPEVTTVSGSKTWIDADDVYNTRPDSIIINLMNGETVVASKEVSADDNWAWSFANLPRYADGQQIRYTITENAVDGYDSTVCGYNVTNTLNNATLTINKRAAGDTDKIPGDTAFIVKNAAGEIVATVYYKDFENGSYTIEGLSVGAYTVTEDFDSAQIDGYKLKVDGGPTAKVEVAVGANAYVGFTNNYEQVPYSYKVVHKFYTDLNGTGYEEDGFNPGKEYFAKTTPDMKDVFEDQGETDKFIGNGATYERKAEYSEKEITAEGNLRAGNLVYTINYYRSNWTEGGLTIKKNISGLDDTSLETLKGKLSFTVKNSAGETVATVPYKDGGMTLTGLDPDTYTIEENNAAVTGYELNVTKVTDVDSTTSGYQVTVSAGSTAVIFNITNDYTSRVYNIWFDGGAHGTVYNAEDTVYRNRWLEFGEGSDAYYDWSGFDLKASGDTLYQLGNSATDKIYASVTAETDPAISEILSNANDTRNMVMYTLTWKDYMEHIRSMQAKWVKPTLVVDKGWVSDKAFYHNGGAVAFKDLEKTLKAMNDYIDGIVAVNEDGDAVQPVYVDANGYYHIYYVAKYTQYKTPTGNLTINKTATGAEVPAGATFTISGTTVDQEAYSTSFTYQDMDDGIKTITLPQGTYTVTETGANVSGYTLSTTVNYGEGAESAVVAEEVNAVVDVVNTYTKKSTGGGGGSIIIPEPPKPEPPVVEIPEEDVPLVDIPEVEIPVTDLPEEDIPLADVPKTGDATALWMAMNALSGTALAGVSLLGRKKREDEEI